MSDPRPSLKHQRRLRTALSILAAAGAAILLAVAVTGGVQRPTQSAERTAPTAVTPWDYSVDTWQDTLGGDETLTPSSYTTLAAWQDPDLTGDDHAALDTLARQTFTADVAGGPQPHIAPGMPAYWAAAPATQCTDLTILATSPAHLPVEGTTADTADKVTRWAKTLIAYSGTCAGTTYTLQAPGVAHIYAALVADTWTPIRSWNIPYDTANDSLPGATTPYDWELKTLEGPCAPRELLRARISVIDAYTQMCQDALNEGVTLTAQSGYRTRAEQAALFANGVETYGSVDAAKRYIAYADDTICTSRHCAGLAINIVERTPALNWLNATAACIDPNGTATNATTCPTGSTPVTRMALYGFAAPLATSRGYLEFVLPIASGTQGSLGTPNCTPTGVSVANQVAAIFRCRLAREGIIGTDQDRIVAEALVVARASSGWNALAHAFAGRFTTTKHPDTGKTYTHAGVFMLTNDQAADWVPGGIDSLTNPIANINAAASIYLTTHSWNHFPFATGTDTTLAPTPALPQHGGPPLPEWAALY